MNSVYDRIAKQYRYGAKTFTIGHEDMRVILADAEEMRQYGIGMNGTPIREACDKIEALLKNGDLEAATAAVNGAKVLYGPSPMIDSIARRVSLISLMQKNG